MLRLRNIVFVGCMYWGCGLDFLEKDLCCLENVCGENIREEEYGLLMWTVLGFLFVKGVWEFTIYSDKSFLIVCLIVSFL